MKFMKARRWLVVIVLVLPCSWRTEAWGAGSQVHYYFTNARQVAVLDLSANQLSVGEEAMNVEACSRSDEMWCVSIPYLSIDIAFPKAGVAAKSWRSGEHLFCAAETITISKQETIYAVNSGKEASGCDQLVSESSFLFSNRRGLLAFSKQGTRGQILFMLLDPMGFGSRP